MTYDRTSALAVDVPAEPQTQAAVAAAVPAVSETVMAGAPPAKKPPAVNRAREVKSPLEPYFNGHEGQRAFWGRRWNDAARGFSAWLADHPRHADADRARLLLNVSRLYAGRAKEAAAGLTVLEAKLPGLEDPVRLLTAEALIRAGDPARALAVLARISDDFAEARAASLLHARALSAANRARDARDAYKAHTAHYPDAAPSVFMALADAEASARGPAKAQAAALREVVARAPHTELAIRADRRLKTLPKKLRALTTPQLTRRLKQQVEARRHKHAAQTARMVQKRTKVGSGAWCEAGYLHGRTLERAKKWAEATALWAKLVSKCKKVDRDVLAPILYFAGKRQMNSGDPNRAFVWFTRIQKEMPEHSFVDDTLVWQADIRRGQGKNKAADKLLTQAIEVRGDMQEKAAWQLFWHHFEQNRFRKAAQVAEKAVSVLEPALMLKSRGRLIYWWGRALHKRGERVRAALAYSRVIREHPLTWYAQLAEQRLRKLDPKAANDALAEARKAQSTDDIATEARDQLKEPRVARAVELLRLGLKGPARSELAGLKHSKKRVTADWLSALLYEQAGDFWQSYRIARWKRPEYQRSWPTAGHEERWRIAHPMPEIYEKAVARAAKAHEIPESLVWSIMRTESGFRPEVVSIANAVGLMQLIVPTGRSMAKQEGVTGRVDRKRLQDPELNIRLGTRYLGKLSRRFEAHPALMAAGYNAGPGGPAKWLKQRGTQELDAFVENIPYNETRKYVKSVVTAWLRYEQLYGENGKAPQINLHLPR